MFKEEIALNRHKSFKKFSFYSNFLPVMVGCYVPLNLIYSIDVFMSKTVRYC